MFKIFIFILIFLLLLCFVLFAQEEGVKFFSSVDKYELNKDEILNFKISVEGKFISSPKIELPKLGDDFDIVATQESQEFSSQGGKSSAVFVSSISLLPKKAGEITIGPAKLKTGNKIYTTEPIKITITPGPGVNREPGENQEDREDQEESEAVTL